MTTINYMSKDEIITYRKVKGIEKFIIRAEEEHSQAVLKYRFGLANSKLGFLQGLREGKSYLTYKTFLNIDESITWAEDKLNQNIKSHNYGECDYWQSYISALNTCKAIIEG